MECPQGLAQYWVYYDDTTGAATRYEVLNTSRCEYWLHIGTQDNGMSIEATPTKTGGAIPPNVGDTMDLRPREDTDPPPTKTGFWVGMAGQEQVRAGTKRTPWTPTIRSRT